MKLAVADLETFRTRSEEERPRDAGVAVLCVWVSWEGGRPGRYYFFSEERLDQAGQLLAQAERVVTFFGTGHDLEILHDFLPALRIAEHYDLGVAVEKVAGRRYGLDELARANVGAGKPHASIPVPQMVREGRWDLLYTRVLGDVDELRELYFYARANRTLFVPLPGGGRWPIDLVVPMPGQPRPRPQPRRKGKATPNQIAALQRLKPWWNPMPGLTNQQASEMLERWRKEAA